MKKEITIYDIAANVGLSPTTVSRALSNHPRVHETTRKKIMDAAKSLGYQSNIFASSLRKRKSKSIGVIVPRLNSPFQSSVLAGMEKIATQSGYNLIISQSMESLDKEISNTAIMYNSRVDGLLVSKAGTTDDIDHFQPFFKKEIPVLFFDRAPDNNHCTGVVINNTQAIYDATEHLIKQGCKRIVHALGNLQINVYADRLKGYKYALMDHGFVFNSENVISIELDEEAGERIVKKILKMHPRPDGLLVSNDTSAASCLMALKKRGIRVPQDIAIVGFNNDLISRMVEPHLSTVNYPSYHMGEVAMKNLINHLDDEHEEILQKTNTITLRSELIIRDSSKRHPDPT
ncbi:LacI family DNA-binding transcriptional regulator [Cyclobacterium xiamenense]|jgi:LacI family transcriptional regulator|uniref:LacI family DNA-binding transcriptional regulator n=1 Tax=Cyclobacterium xiamenense TaxID=1297121 RepID=UPI0012B89E5C|nr:LacI family DNA-binding transcriptional regulator [Cyclobacterium xiamenense]